mgnify:CR=1 FL=1
MAKFREAQLSDFQIIGFFPKLESMQSQPSQVQETVDDGRDDTVNPKYTQVRRKLTDGKMIEVENRTTTYNELYGQNN